MKPTQSQIRAEIAALEFTISNGPVKSSFGADNADVIRKQIEVLKGRMDSQSIEDHRDEWGEYASDLAMQAFFWMIGESKDSPSTEWTRILK